MTKKKSLITLTIGIPKTWLQRFLDQVGGLQEGAALHRDQSGVREGRGKRTGGLVHRMELCVDPGKPSVNFTNIL